MAAITNTSITVPARAPFTVPGALSVAEVRTAFGSELGLTNMEGTSRDDSNAGVRYVEFKHRTGNKG